MVIGIITLIFCYSLQSIIMHEVFLVASWVFIWIAIEKYFLERIALKRKRMQISDC